MSKTVGVAIEIVYPSKVNMASERGRSLTYLVGCGRHSW